MSTLIRHHEQYGARFVEIDSVRVPAHFGDACDEYDACRNRVGLHDRNYRGLIEITGRDRAAWLSNLVTNEIKSLAPGRGNYLFALNVKGRILFDANVLVLPDALWLDLDRRRIPAALTHLEKYIIMEDVQLADRSDDFARLALIGDTARATAVSAVLQTCATSSPALDLRELAQLQHAAVQIGSANCRLLRHDFCGLPAFELIVPAEKSLSIWRHVASGASPQPVGLDAVQILRVEAGLPWSVQDIDEEVLPAETRQLDRAVSFTKGCYLGQEVVERMRAHHVVAKLLVGLSFDDSSVAPGSTLLHDGQPVGRVTSVVNSIKLGRLIGLGYIKSALAVPGTSLTAASAARTLPCFIHELPLAH